MGMYSWCCKGCGHELNMGEFVRFAGRNQVYDGYGGGVTDYTPIAWHSRCYYKASDKEKLDETPSKHADNQGMGFPKLEFMEFYNEKNKTAYSAVVYCALWGEKTRQEWQLHLTPNGLEDEITYDKRMEAAYETLRSKRPDNYWEDFNKLSEEEKNAAFKRDQEEAERLVGGPNPIHSSLKFDSFQSCLEAVDPLIVNFLPKEVNGCYHLVIFGTQEKADGSVYERRVQKAWDRTGNWQDWKELDYNETEIWKSPEK